MAVARHFIGWNEPVVLSVRRVLVPDPPAGPVDLAADLIIVPTRQAGRRLRKTMAVFCSRTGGSLLSVRVETPSFLFRENESLSPPASSAAVKAVWADLLTATDLAAHPALFPARPLAKDYAWALAAGEMIQRLRNDLADGGYRIRDVPAKLGDQFEERDRWLDLARLEAKYLEKIAGLGLGDPCERKMTAAVSPALPDGVRRIVVAAVPDPPQLAVRALEQIAQKIPVDILIAAPEDHAGFFDAWGRPMPARWSGENLDIPSPDDNLLLAATPREQSRIVLAEIARSARDFGPCDTAVGVPDRSVIPFLEEDLADHGLSAFDPAEHVLREHAIFSLVERLARLLTDQRYSDFANLVRHPHVLSWLSTADTKGAGISSGRLLGELDRFHGAHLPITMADMMSRFPNGGYDGSIPRERFNSISGTIQRLSPWIGTPMSANAGRGIRDFLIELYGTRRIGDDDARGREFAAAGEQLNSALHEIEDARDAHRLKPVEAMLLLLRRMGELEYEREREDAVIDLEGWLELPWNDAPFMLVTGMNETFVPDGRIGDMFLPDSLRAKLGMRDDSSRLARDAYIMKILVENRRNGGRAVFIAGKTGESGDPLKPSRLLFRCPDGQLPARAAKLFGPLEPSRNATAFTLSFKLDPSPCPDSAFPARMGNRLPVTAFRSYLACPFRFFLRYILGMTESDYDKREPDAMEFGQLVHHALSEMGKDGAMKKCKDERRLGEFLEAKARKWARHRYGNAPGLPVRLSLDAAIARLRSAARTQAACAAEGWEIIEAEQEHRMTIEGATVTGIIDRVDRHTGTGVIRLIDYKTSDTWKEPEDAHLVRARHGAEPFLCVRCDDKEKQWTDLQLPLYRLMLPGETRGQTGPGDDRPTELCYFNMPADLSHTAMLPWSGFDGQMLASAQHCAEEVVRRIACRRFWPPAGGRVAHDEFRRLFPEGVQESVCLDEFKKYMEECGP